MTKKKMILTIGVSASGKTTWAEQFVRDRKELGDLWVNINRDDIRSIIFAEKTGKNEDDFTWAEWNKGWEKPATSRWKDAIKTAMKWYDNIIISDTNLNPSIRDMLGNMAREKGFDVENKHFPIEFDVAVKRDLARKNPVGAMVIASQMKMYWEQFSEKYVPDTSLPKAVLVDIDGTVAHANNRGIYDSTLVHTDTPDRFVISVVRGLKDQGFKIIFLSGREDKCRDVTAEWLEVNLGFKPDVLAMRTTGDMRRDSIVKKEIFNQYIRNFYWVEGVIDDRPQVIMECWGPLGIQVLKSGQDNPYIWF